MIRFLEEKNNNSRVTRSMKNFDEFIRDLELSDPTVVNAQYTWLHFRENPICCRMD